MIYVGQDYDPDHPKGVERCFHKFMGKPWTLEYLCCVEDPSTCFPEYDKKSCLKHCPPLRKGRKAPPPSPGAIASSMNAH